MSGGHYTGIPVHMLIAVAKTNGVAKIDLFLDDEKVTAI
jgi:hypothetical protein